MRLTFAVFLCFVLLSSCEKNLNFTLHETPNVLVVDAAIENNKPPVVVLSKSLGYFSQISPLELLNSFAHNADVYVSNGVSTQKLKEYHVDSTGGFQVYYYTIDSTNLSAGFLGSYNQAYTLKIIYNGIEYNASTTIPLLAKKVDSMWWKPRPFETDTTKVTVMVKATDPPGLGNYIRYFTKTNRGPFLPAENSVFDDQIIDGTTYEVPLDPGIDRNNRHDGDRVFHRGDTVTLKFCNIDRTTYQFWVSMEFAYQSIGNPFSSPNRVLGNISNGALGALCGYAVYYKTLIIPK